MIDDRKVGAFISIPKCATKTILDMFELGINRDDDSENEFNSFIIYENHQRLSVLEEIYDLSNLFVFTFVRNPYDRIKSWFQYHIKDEAYRSKTLNEWISQGCKTTWTIQNKTNWKAEHKSPLLQYNFVEGGRGLDYIGKIENFEEDCKFIIAKLNGIFVDSDIPKNIKYKHTRINCSGHIDDIITPENKEIIYEMFKKDFEYFGYLK